MSIYGEGAYECEDCGVVYPELRAEEQLKKRKWEMKCPNCDNVVKPISTSEDKPLHPTSIYAITKRDQEEMCLTVGRAYGIPTVALRYFNVYGPRAGDIYVQDYAHVYGLKTGVFRMSCIYGIRQFGVEDQGWVAWFTIAALTGKPVTIYGDGKQVRDVLYISDLIRAYDLLVKSNLKQEVFNIGGGHENTLSLLVLFDYLKEVVGKRTKVSYSDWRPEVDPKEGVRKLVKWVEQNKELFR